MKRRLLVVDDEPPILLTLKAILEMYGFEVETAPSASQALTKLQTSNFDLVITDMKMEHARSGYDVVHAARDTDYQPAVVILTAYPLLGHDWKKEGAQSLFVKPMNTKELVRQIEDLLIIREDQKEKGQWVAMAHT